MRMCGPTIFTQNLINGLRALGVSITLFYFDEGGCGGEGSVRLKFWRPYDFSEFDIVHSTGLRPDIYNAFIARHGRARRVTALHAFIEDDLRMGYGGLKAFVGTRVWEMAIRRIGVAIVSSLEMQVYYKARWGWLPSRLPVIPYGIDKIRDGLPIDPNDVPLFSAWRSSGKKIVVSCGVLTKRKAFDTLVRAFESIDDAVLVVIGEGGERRSLERLIGELDLNDRVFLIGARAHSFRYYEYCDVYAHTSYSEGFGLAMLEALRVGMPLVCSDLEIYHGFFGPDDVAWFPPGTVSQLAAAIRRALRNGEELSSKSKALFQRHFLLEKMAKRHVDLYIDMVGGGQTLLCG